MTVPPWGSGGGEAGGEGEKGEEEEGVTSGTSGKLQALLQKGWAWDQDPASVHLQPGTIMTRNTPPDHHGF